MKVKVLMIALLLAGSVHAAEQQSATVEISLELAATCVLDVSNVQGFGLWPTGGANPVGVALGSISVHCAADMPYAVGMDSGQYYDGSHRRMSNGEQEYVPYVLRVGSSNGVEWGDAGLNAMVSDYVETNTASAVYGTGDGSEQTFFIFGDADTSAAPEGVYSDYVNVTVVW